MQSLQVIFLLALVLVLCVCAEAQQDRLNHDWLGKDLQGVSSLLEILPFENQNLEGVKGRLRGDWSVEETNLGFGGRHLILGKGNGYTREYVNALIYEGRVAQYEAGIESFSSEWPQIKEIIARKWKGSNGPEASLEEHKLVYRRSFDSIVTDYRKRIASRLGSLNVASVPPYLATAYEELTNPMNNSTISGTTRSEEIDALIKAERLDLLENVLEGSNPGARVLAALSFLELKSNGTRLPQATLRAIDTVLNLSIQLHACVFDMCSDLRAADALLWFKSGKAFPRPVTKRRAL